MHKEILKAFNNISKLSVKGEELICEIFKPVTLKKKSYFLETGQKNNKVAFINKGLVRYFVTKNDEESNLEFTGEFEFITDHPSFVNKGFSYQNIQALEDCELLVASNDDLQRMYNVMN